ncbi:Uncharacterized protein TCM_003554 [Theobroma cacao]|uniref:Reverse transcriptase domain-containing protein n=1 Tax=Theobroma cacao TaxID=3641 RepID=A0A061DW28_THECC|nr:Uncharacterized protein TCM_003554 [Theobroma cacao]
MKKRLRQRCPISSILFNIVVKALSMKLHSAGDKSLIKGIKVGKRDTTFTHLQYADDMGIGSNVGLVLCPFRVEIFCRQLLCKKLAVKEMLVRKGLLREWNML